MGSGAAITLDAREDRALSDAATIEVTERIGQPTRYRLRFEADIVDGDLPLLTDRRLDPGRELAVLVPDGERIVCLVKGPVHAQQMHLEHGGGGSWLEVQGSDTSIAMDRESRSVIWKDGRDSDFVTKILQANGYAATDVQQTATRHVEAKHVVVQRDSDLRFIRRLARRNGCLFRVTADAAGKETAHFRRPPVSGSSAVTLTLNRQPASLAALDLSWDIDRPTSVVGAQLDLNGKLPITGDVARSPLPSLAKTAVGSIATGTRSVFVSAPADDAGDLRARGEAVLMEAEFFVRASCRTSVSAAGAVVRSQTLATVDGAGSRHSGRYLVSAVHHVVDAAAHYMDIELVRNSWGG